MRKISLLPILIVLFIGLLILREFKSNSHEPEHQLVQMLTNQGYQEVKVTNSDFGFCPRVLEIPVRFQASLQNKIIEGIACFSPFGSNPRIQFKNQ